MSLQKNSIQLKKGEHTYVFEYEPGRGKEILMEIIELAEDDTSDFDWIDAAIIAYELKDDLL